MYKTIRNRMEKAILDYEMIQDGDRILIGVSGGADSYALLRFFGEGFIHVTNRFSIVAVHVDLGFGKGSQGIARSLEKMFKQMDVDYQIIHTTISREAFSNDAKKNPCFICSVKRRRKIYEAAHTHQCNKVAYGHHMDDVIETLLINILFGRKVEAIHPVQEVFKGKMHIIRPFFYIEEDLIKKLAAEYRFPQFPSLCPAEETSRRRKVKVLIEQLQSEEKYANIRQNIFRSLFRVNMDFFSKMSK
jgi:tRNA 2-thiocytidine biosynthesis protein TtcA